MWEAIQMVIFSIRKSDWVSTVVMLYCSQETQNLKTGSTDVKTVVKDFNGQPMFYFADNGPGHGVILCSCASQSSGTISRQFCQGTQIVWFKSNLLEPGVVYTSITE